MIICYLQNGFRSRRFGQHLAICIARFALHRKETAPENLRVHIGRDRFCRDGVRTDIAAHVSMCDNSSIQMSPIPPQTAQPAPVNPQLLQPGGQTTVGHIFGLVGSGTAVRHPRRRGATLDDAAPPSTTRCHLVHPLSFTCKVARTRCCSCYYCHRRRIRRAVAMTLRLPFVPSSPTCQHLGDQLQIQVSSCHTWFFFNFASGDKLHPIDFFQRCFRG